MGPADIPDSTEVDPRPVRDSDRDSKQAAADEPTAEDLQSEGNATQALQPDVDDLQKGGERGEEEEEVEEPIEEVEGASPPPPPSSFRTRGPITQNISRGTNWGTRGGGRGRGQ